MRRSVNCVWMLLLLSGVVHAVVPTAPTSLVATAVSTSQINLSWTDTSNNETNFKIERRTGSGGTYAQIATTATNVATFSNTGRTAGTTYFYRVRASNASGNSAYTNEASATTIAADKTAPTAPSGLVGTVLSQPQIKLSWTASIDDVGVTGYLVDRCQGTGCSAFVQVGTSTGSNFSDTDVSVNASYSYRVRAADAVGNLSAYSTILSMATRDTITPSAPSGLTATAASSSQVNLAWSASTDNVAVTGYQVDRCQGAGCTTFIRVATPTGTSFNDTGLAPSTSYSYRVRATDAAGNVSGNSNIATATTQAPPDLTPPTAPSGLSATAAGTTQINLAWTASTDNVAVTGYRVERCQGTGCTSFVQVGTTTATSFSDMGLAAATSYSYRVRATDTAGNLSAYSNVASATVNVTSLTVTSPSPEAVVASDNVTVSGTFIGPSNTGIAVNGVVAAIVGNTFVAANVPLQTGANTLTAALTTPNNQTTSQTLSVTSTGPAAIEVSASPTQGVAPLTVAFTVNIRTRNTIQSVLADFTGSGNFVNLGAVTTASNTYSAGTYQVGFIVNDSAGVQYAQTITIVVQDLAQIDQMLQTTWWGFTTVLAAQDTTQALQYFNAQAQATYGPVISALLPNLPQIVASFSTPQLVSVSGDVGEYAVSRTINGVDQLFFIYFARDADGVWRLDSM